MISVRPSQPSANGSLMRLPKPGVSAGAYICAAAGVLLLPLSWLTGWTIAVTVHESAHLLVLYWQKVPVQRIEIGLFGAKITTGLMTAGQELICAAAGPLSSLMLLAFGRSFPAAALIGLVQGIFNLLPFAPFDGGRMIRAAVSIFREGRGM